MYVRVCVCVFGYNKKRQHNIDGDEGVDNNKKKLKSNTRMHIVPRRSDDRSGFLCAYDRNSARWKVVIGWVCLNRTCDLANSSQWALWLLHSCDKWDICDRFTYFESSCSAHLTHLHVSIHPSFVGQHVDIHHAQTHMWMW